MNKIKKFNQFKLNEWDEYEEENEIDSKKYDYSSYMKPITPQNVREYIVELLENAGMDVENENANEMIDLFVKRKMYALWSDLNYMSENNEGDIEDILNGNYEPNELGA